MSDDLAELQREWRKIVLDKLNNLEEGQKQLTKELADHRLSSVAHEELNFLSLRVAQLENSKQKLIGILIGVNALLAAIGWWIDHT